MESETKSTGSELRLESSPVVGLHVTRETDSEAVASAILRAQRHDHEVFVVVDPDVGAEARDFVERLDAMIVGGNTYSEFRNHWGGS